MSYRLASATLLAAMALAACGADGNGAADAPSVSAPLVEVVAAAPLGAPGSIQASGFVEYRRETELAFNAPGVVASLSADAGDVVRRGQRLATLRRTSVGSNVAEAAIARENAERNLARTQELYERGFVSEARLETARLAVERARDSAVLTAPADGVILRRGAEISQTVAAGAPIFSFGETGSGLVVRAPVPSQAASRVHIGDAATVRLTGANTDALAGRVTRVGAQGAAGTGAFEVEVEITDAAELRSGMVAAVEIAAAPSANAEAALLVPMLSLLDARADQGVVFVVDSDGIARRRRVQTAGVTQAGVLVVAGLTPGERVVSAGAAYVRDGEPVRIAAAS